MAVYIDVHLFIGGLVQAATGNFTMQIKLLLQPLRPEGVQAGIGAGGGLVVSAVKHRAGSRMARTAQGINAPDEAIEVICRQ